MARRVRVEIEGGLYHLIARGNDRQDIFHSDEDHLKFISLLAKQKERFEFYLYAFCLMTNHFHLLIERQTEPIGRIMQRLLTGYSQYYNRRYRHVGHVFQGRHKAILCQSEAYLGKLVRYIHLNPVRAGMVTAAEGYPYSSHRAYLGLDPIGIVDVDPVLRLFGNRREIAQMHFAAFVGAQPDVDEDKTAYSYAENDILGSEEFVDAAIHRLGNVERKVIRPVKKTEPTPFDADTLVAAVEVAFGMPRGVFCGSSKTLQAILAKEALILVGKEAGATLADLSTIIGLDSSSLSRRHDAARHKVEKDRQLTFAKELVTRIYHENIAKTQV